jgi:chlorite dismutase
MKAYRHLIKYALAKGCTVSVWDGEEWQIKRSTSLKEITEAVESVEEAALRIRSATGETIVQSVTVSAFGLEDDETIIDYTVCPFMDEYEAATA